MPSVESHLWKANRDFQFLQKLLADEKLIQDHSEWAVISAFYVAVHLVESVLAVDGRHSISHESRKAVLLQENRYKHLREHYLPLYRQGMLARYLNLPPRDPAHADDAGFSGIIALDAIRREVVGHRLNQVLRSAKTLLPAKHHASLPVLERSR